MSQSSALGHLPINSGNTKGADCAVTILMHRYAWLWDSLLKLSVWSSVVFQFSFFILRGELGNLKGVGNWSNRFCCQVLLFPLFSVFLSFSPSLLFSNFFYFVWQPLSILWCHNFRQRTKTTIQKNNAPKYSKPRSTILHQDFRITFAMSFKLASFRHLSYICLKVQYITIFYIIFILCFMFSIKTFAKIFFVFRCFRHIIFSYSLACQ